MKRPLMLAGLILLVGCAAQPQGQNETWAQARQKTVLLENAEGSRGTGVVINDKCVLSVQHVMEGEEIKATLASGKVLTLKRVAYDSATDVAASCAAGSLGSPTAKIGPAPLAYSSVFTIGFPLGYRYTLTEGQYQQEDLATIPCAPGNSGGGVFDPLGNVVGLVDSIPLEHTENGTLAFPHLCGLVSLSQIEALLDANHIGYQHG